MPKRSGKNIIFMVILFTAGIYGYRTYISPKVANHKDIVKPMDREEFAEELTKNCLKLYRTGVENYKALYNKYPETLSELVNKGIIPHTLCKPGNFNYNLETGEVINPKFPLKRPVIGPIFRE